MIFCDFLSIQQVSSWSSLPRFTNSLSLSVIFIVASMSWIADIKYDSQVKEIGNPKLFSIVAKGFMTNWSNPTDQNLIKILPLQFSKRGGRRCDQKSAIKSLYKIFFGKYTDKQANLILLSSFFKSNKIMQIEKTKLKLNDLVFDKIL